MELFNKNRKDTVATSLLVMTLKRKVYAQEDRLKGVTMRYILPVC